jgi:shikimate dehydrogenase
MSKIKGTTRVCGLIGNPVEHSISPLIHNTLAELCGIDMVYTTFRVERGEVSTAVKGAFALNILGMNVTVPHKQEVLASLEETDELAAAIGAVNTLVRTESGFKGYNTDMLGLKRALEEENVVLRDSRVILLGAGGAARAIAFLCVSSGAKEVYILNRTLEKAAAIAEDVNRHLKTDAAHAMRLSDYDKLQGSGYIVLQTTSVGLYPDCDNAAILDEEFYKKAAAGVDIIYNPAETKFMKLIKQQGKPAYNGLKMLLYQGVSAFELWNNLKVDAEKTQLVYEKMKEELKINE